VSIDGVRLELWWSRLTAIVDEAASAMLRTAFSTIIRESNGLHSRRDEPLGRADRRLPRGDSGVRGVDLVADA
jgi:hypothetical protein